MGNENENPKKSKIKAKLEKIKSKIKKIIKEKKTVDEITCPFCEKIFDASNISSVNYHFKSCIKSKTDKLSPCILYPTSLDIDLNQLIFINILEYEKNEPNNYNDRRIEDKINELKEEIKKKKLLNKTHTYIDLKRENLLSDTLKETQNIVNLYKDWKIKFIGEEGVDVGGLLRDFFSNIFEILEGDQLKLFIPGESSDISFILNHFLMQNEENFKYCIDLLAYY